MKTKRQLKRRLHLLYVVSFIVTLAPLIAVLAINWRGYTETAAETVKLTVGGVLVAIFMLLKVLGKLKIPRRVVCYSFVFALAYLLEAVLADLMILSGAALLGEVVDYIFLQRAIKGTKDAVLAAGTADATAERVEAILNNYIGGRV
jgi:hypothetical protein